MNSLSKSLAWTAFIQAARVAIQLLSIAVLSRLISVNSYGAMAACFAVINLAYVFKDSGVAASVIRSDKVDIAMLGTAQGVATSLGLVIFLSLQLAAGYIAKFMRVGEAEELIRIVSFAFIASGLSSVPQALLERKAEFRTLAGIEVAAGCFAFSLALGMALSGYGHLALAVSFLANIVLASALIISKDISTLKISFRVREFKEVAGFGSGVLGFNIVNYIARNADVPIISRALGAGQLGYWAQAYKIMLFPVQNVTGAVNRAIYPELCRRVRSNTSGRDLFERSLRSISFLVWPLMLIVAGFSDLVIDLLLGTKWRPAAPVLFWLSLTGCIQAIVSTTGGLFQAYGETWKLFRLGVIATTLQLAAFILGADGGIVEVAKFYFIANLVNSVVALRAAFRVTGTDFQPLVFDLSVSLAIPAIALSVSLMLGSLFEIPAQGVFQLLLGLLIYTALLIMVLYRVAGANSGNSFTERIMLGWNMLISGSGFRPRISG